MSSPPQNNENRQISIAIDKRVSILDNITLYEYFPRNRLIGLMKSGLLKDTWNTNNYSQKLAALLYANETQQLQSYKVKTTTKPGKPIENW